VESQPFSLSTINCQLSTAQRTLLVKTQSS
jgi:hypothetical protein